VGQGLWKWGGRAGGWRRTGTGWDWWEEVEFGYAGLAHKIVCISVMVTVKCRMAIILAAMVDISLSREIIRHTTVAFNASIIWMQHYHR